MKDFYKLLQVARTASQQEIKKAYRQLALKHHPDQNDAKESEELFKKMTEAYRTLTHPQLKREYDEALQQNYYGQEPFEVQKNRYEDDADFASRSGKTYGINEEVWYAHHYGAASRNQKAPGRLYGMNIAEEMKEEYRKAYLERTLKNKEFGSDAAYFIRREARLKEKERKIKKNKREDSDGDECTIS